MTFLWEKRRQSSGKYWELQRQAFSRKHQIQQCSVLFFFVSRLACKTIITHFQAFGYVLTIRNHADNSCEILFRSSRHLVLCRPISAHSASTVISSEKSSISTYRKSTTRFPTSHRWTVYVTHKSPKGWHKNAISLLVPVKFNFSRNKSATKFLCVKTSSGKVVATSFPYPTVHGSIAGDVPIYLKLAFKVTHPFRKRRFPKLSFLK